MLNDFPSINFCSLVNIVKNKPDDSATYYNPRFLCYTKEIVHGNAVHLYGYDLAGDNQWRFMAGQYDGWLCGWKLADIKKYADDYILKNNLSHLEIF